MSQAGEDHRRANHLAGETSPYLQQHAQNPVDWYPWGEEAFEKARREDRPIFLSVGYSSCHWCHVMERESFESEEVAEILNRDFVSIKVDREERPDVDALYMAAVQTLTGSGGWPMSVFLRPDLKPFFGGTYFPPDGAYGRPGFKDVLRRMAQYYREEREKVDRTAEDLTRHLGASIVPEGSEVPGPEIFETFYLQARRTFDSTHGGFGGAPKFPHSADLSVLLRYWRRSGDPFALDMATLSLRKMAGGGMYDQLGGGFHRYSVDGSWLVPHFEKMLYDNGLLARTYLEAFQVTGDAFYGRIATEILDYVCREMTSPEGAFYSATDADSEGEEGRFFVWRPEEIEEVLGAEDARLFNLYYNVTEGGNFEKRTSILNVTRSIEDLAAAFKIAPEELRSRIERGRKTLYAVRERRVHPFRDEKIICAWNGLLLGALARAHQLTGSAAYREAAERNARFLRERCVVDGVLHRIHRDGETRIPGFLDDYSYVAEAALDLYEATFDLEHLEFAMGLVDSMLDEFGDPGGPGLFETSSRHRHLLHRRKDYVESATPAGNWVAASVLARLGRLTGRADYRRQAAALLGGLQSLVERAPSAFSTALLAVDLFLGPLVEFAVIGEQGSEACDSMLRAIHGRFLPRKVVAGASDRVGEGIAEKVPLLKDRGRVDGRATVYICENFSCQTPITSQDALETALDALEERRA